MVFPMKLALNATAEIASIADFPKFRFFMTGLDARSEPQWDLAEEPQGCDGLLCNRWVEANASYLAEFSALCYMTARDIAKLHLGGRPVGLVQSAWGGTRLEAWMSAESLSATSVAKHVPSKSEQNAASVLFNAMVAPWNHMAVRAAFWYQGEANADQKVAEVDQRAYYAELYQAMIKDWRDRKGMGDFAWLTMQLPPSVAAGTAPSEQMGTGRMEIRLAQAESDTRANGLTDISGLAVGLDLGGRSAWGIDHPPNKNEMARRLALQAIHVAYAEQGRQPSLIPDQGDTVWTGPQISSIERATSSKIVLHFTALSSDGMRLDDVKAFNSDGSSNDCTLCCEGAPPFEVTDGVTGYSSVPLSDIAITNSSIELAVPSEQQVTHVRYAWLDYAECVLRNSDGLPAGPFEARVQAAQPLIAAARDATAAGSDPVPPSFRRPPMGWNSWNFYHCNIDENSVKAIADAMVENGMKDAGYEYINVDDCWQVERHADGTIEADPVRFPSGMKAVADYTHSQGLKFGVYTARGSRTCQNRPGAYAHEEIDSATYCDWGLDYLKIDNCGGTNWPEANQSWIKFAEGLDACYGRTGRYTVRSVEFCTDPAECGQWIAGLANLWRTTEDIQPTYDSMMSNIHENDKMAAIAQPGHFNDPDMMNVGVVGLSLVEQYTHMSLWCVAGAPLLVGADIVHATAETLAILTNKEVIGINQDLGYQGAVQGRIVAKYSSPMTEVWSKRLEDGNSYGVVLLNLDSSPANITAQWSDLGGLSGPAAVRDLWSHEERGMFDGSFQAEVPSHGVVFVRVTRQTVVI